MATPAATAAARVSALTLADFARLMRTIPIGPTERLAVGVSGGPDSMALLMLLNKWAPGRVHAITVDHKLRDDSTDEAQRVHSYIKSKGISSEIVTADWDRPVSELSTAQIEERARSVRYRLLAHATRNAGSTRLFLGQHRNDQIETILYRLTRASGLGGLGGMQTVSEMPVILHPHDRDIQVVRPLLSVPKVQLEETCRELDVPVEHDPMNAQMAYQRNVLRDVLKVVHKDPNASPLLSEGNLVKFCSHVAEYSAAANAHTKSVLEKSALTDPLTGSAFLHLPHLATQPNHWFHRPHLANSVLSNLVRWVDCAHYPPPLGAVAHVRDVMAGYYYYGLADDSPNHGTSGQRPRTRWVRPPHQGEYKAMTISKSLVLPPRPDRNGVGNWIIVRSPPLSAVRARDRIPLVQGQTVLFDTRFFVTLGAPVLSKHDEDAHLREFYRSLVQHFPLDRVRNMTIPVAPADGGPVVDVVTEGPDRAERRNLREHPFSTSAGSDDLEVIVRYFDQQDEMALSGVFQRRHVHPAWSQFRRAWEHFRYKMPFVGRYVVPVIAVRNRNYAGIARASGPPTPVTQGATGVKPGRKGVAVTKATVDSPLGAVVAIPCLSINFAPDVLSVQVEHRKNLIKVGGEEA
ncbi:tRNA(Ile)-lysidine synthetase [Allomyces macrogynus ATCC 38327]|uniref:tRNA(Ile)-lysidine synthetase n=2 Tax=Allomyces macrogynus (strain ATCC 38327) TaxID=578462 RepID=A0A0L0TC96_ALLM3|nr:tRNA(Ile)-lysidine synthetase [Allomyces macrogynus ATCC 38327]|eukprot:KNE72336.1 tRNA(Ile)-lysidine synthetase [Allomyces macrogynus ATCC 38327]